MTIPQHRRGSMSNNRALTIELLRQCAVVQENRQTTIVAPNEAIASFLLYRFLELAQIYHHYKCIILTLRGKAIARVDIGK